MTLPLSRIIFDRNFPLKLPTYIRNLAIRERKRFFLTLGAKYFPERLHLRSQAILDWSSLPDSDGKDQLNQNIAGMKNLRVVERRHDYPITNPREASFLHAAGLPETNIYAATTFTCELTDATLQMDDGIVCSRDMQLLADSALDLRRLELSSAFGSPKHRGAYLHGTYSSIWGPHATNHWHWLFEALPRLYSLTQATSEPVTLLMPEGIRAAQKLSLAWCLPTNVSVDYVPRHSWWQVERFIFPSFTVDVAGTLMQEAHTRYVRHSVLRAVNLSDNLDAGRKRIYISRAQAYTRRLENEAEIVALLKEYDFECYVLEILGFEEQVRLFHDAELVIAPHGAGLANMLFAGSIPFVELTSPFLSPCFFMLAKLMGQEHHYIYSVPDEKVRSNRDARIRDFSVSVDELEREVHEAIRSPLLIQRYSPKHRNT